MATHRTKRHHREGDLPSPCTSPPPGVRLTLDDVSCPITHCMMQHPAVAADGHTYERAAIRRWLLGNRMNSPMTNEPLDNRVLRPNHALRRICAMCAAAASAAAREEAQEAARMAAVLDDRQLDRLSACVAAAETHRESVKRWSFAMDGDMPEDVALLLVLSLTHAVAKTRDTVCRALVALQRVAAVSREGAVAAGAPECALRILSVAEDAREIDAALAVIAAVGGGSRGAEALAAVQRELRRPGGLAALAALLPSCDPEQLRGCAQGLIEALGSSSSVVVSSAMQPAAALVAADMMEPVRDAMAAAMLAFHTDDAVQVAALRALSEHTPRRRDGEPPGHGLHTLGYELTAQLLRAHATGSRAVKEAAMALCEAMGTLAVAAPPPPVETFPVDSESEGEEGSSEEDEWDDLGSD